MTVSEDLLAKDGAPKNFLLDPYRDWAAGEGIPIHLDFGHDLIALETGPWDRYDARGCFAFTHGAGDFAVGGRLVAQDGAGAWTRIDDSAALVARDLGIAATAERMADRERSIPRRKSKP